MGNVIPKIPLDVWIRSLIDFLTDNFESVFNVITVIVGTSVKLLNNGLLYIPPLLLIVIFLFISWKVSNWQVGIFTTIGLLLILNLGYWEHAIDTLALVISSVFISIFVGVPLGIGSVLSKKMNRILNPILDFMQTMPPFIYLIPAIFFFGLGMVPGVLASVIFAMPPTIRLTSLGIRQISEEIIEAADSFGSTTLQKLFKVQIPLAIPTIMAGVNQSIMLSLSMVVIASMIGTPGLGTEVLRAVSSLDVGKGFEAGLCIVILAIALDRISKNFAEKKQGV